MLTRYWVGSLPNLFFWPRSFQGSLRLLPWVLAPRRMAWPSSRWSTKVRGDERPCIRGSKNRVERRGRVYLHPYLPRGIGVGVTPAQSPPLRKRCGVFVWVVPHHALRHPPRSVASFPRTPALSHSHTLSHSQHTQLTTHTHTHTHAHTRTLSRTPEGFSGQLKRQGLSDAEKSAVFDEMAAALAQHEERQEKQKASAEAAAEAATAAASAAGGESKTGAESKATESKGEAAASSGGGGGESGSGSGSVPGRPRSADGTFLRIVMVNDIYTLKVCVRCGVVLCVSM